MRTVLLATLALTACVRFATPAVHVDARGERWVQLSSLDNVVPAIAEVAADAGCDVYVHSSAFLASCKDERSADQRIRVSQQGDRLIYRCDQLEGDECDRMMMGLAPTQPRCM